ncbi:hypothetical protein Desdi_1172 [Desulfitobacterium dichloroeliminans LMG P-21439]|uniref:Uncharacterized protein n=1 Tax=Desulfitobacterium dichloroeliminans (strain LMG P-21439 / DCA1) TaxID=871963 RepID=L0F6P0_DESDL|nr:DUF4652 domain-containing protein [Desulfitobacterium dichloroeliminans]AGA68685.1 hypothetical protein Desdi_1172 [Desulfitobacterium dichloroeliminans LMG P-21439]
MNFGIFPLNAFRGPSAEELTYSETLVTNPDQTPQQRMQEQRANYAAYVKKVKTAVVANPSETNSGLVKGESLRSESTAPTKELFRVTTNPYVPDFILQGNYVVHGSSPDKRYTAYIYPDEWETIGDIYIKDSANSSWSRLQLDQEYRVRLWDYYAPEGKYTPKKKILWINDDEFITIIGFAHGTVSKGGELVKIHRAAGKGEILYPADHKLNQEVIDFEQIGDDLVLNINLIDANGFCLEKSEMRVPLSGLDSLTQGKVAISKD